MNRSRGRTVPILLAFAVGLVGSPGAALEGPSANVEITGVVSTIAFVSTRDNPTAPFAEALEIYLMDGDGTNPRRLTVNADADAFPALSPDLSGKIVFDSNRLRTPDEPFNTSDLFLMEKDGSGQRFLTRGSSATWSPDAKFIAYHRSASGTGLPIRPDPGAPTLDSDIFTLTVDDVELGLLLAEPINLTNSLDIIDEDADWSPDGRYIAFTRHGVTAALSSTEIYVITVDGTEPLRRLTNNLEEERAPAWSPDGTRIAFMCRRGGGGTFEICVMNADGSVNADGRVDIQLTVNSVGDLTPAWSPDGHKIMFQRGALAVAELFLLDFERFLLDGKVPVSESQFTNTVGINAFANWGEIDTTPPTIAAVVSPAPNANGWNNTSVMVSWNVSDPESGIASSSGCTAITLTQETSGMTLTCSARNGAGLSASTSVIVRIDMTGPTITFTGNAGTYTVDQTILVTCSASDALSGIETMSCPAVASGPATDFVGNTTTTSTTLTATAADYAGNSASASTTFTVTVTADGICRLTASLPTADDLCAKATSIATAPNAAAKARTLDAFDHFLAAQSGKSIPADLATLLSRLAHLL